MQDELYTEKQVKELLKVDRQSLWRWRKEGLIKTIKLGKLNRYSKEEIERVMQKGL